MDQAAFRPLLGRSGLTRSLQEVLMPDHGDFDYAGYGATYAAIRQADPRIAAHIRKALGGAGSVLNVGAGAGSYEPCDCYVLALEPAADMRAKRPVSAVPAIAGTADAIPFDDNSVDACMSVLSVHHWRDLEAGLREMRRVTRGPVVIMTFDPGALRGWWLNDLCPEVLDVEARRYPPLDRLCAGLGGRCKVERVPVARDCTDGFSEAFFARPEAFLNPEVMKAQSAWGFVSEQVKQRFVHELSELLVSGEWDARYGHWRNMPVFEGGVRLIVATP
jgi:SAM-dependent methyltransferase